MSTVSDTDVKLYLQLANPDVSGAPLPAAAEAGEGAEDEDPYTDDEGEGGGDFGEGYGADGIGMLGDDGDVGDGANGAIGAMGANDDVASDAFDVMPSSLQPVTQMDAASLEIEKQSCLLELERLRAQGVRLTKEFTLDDDLTVMQWEIRKQLMLIDELNSVSFMKDAMKLAFTGVEALNSKVQLLELDGWAAHASTELSGSRFDHSLSKLYRKYWRRGETAPEMELAMGILGSIGSYHFKRKLFSSRPTARRAPPVLDDSDDEEAPQ